MQWLELLTSVEAGVELGLASLSCAYLVRYAWRAPTRPRRVGAVALALVCAGLTLEAALFLSQAPAAASLPWSAALVVVRSALVLSAALIGALVARDAWSRR